LEPRESGEILPGSSRSSPVPECVPSFVAPQLNGVMTLLGQSVQSRIGLLNFPLYDLGHGLKGYKGSQPSLRFITDGDNWFYSGFVGYSPAAGLGTLDVANFAAYLRSLAD